MQTGYYGRATEYGHRAKHTNVHFVREGKPLCGYKPHKTMKFQFCAEGVKFEYVTCDRCKKAFRERDNKAHHSHCKGESCKYGEDNTCPVVKENRLKRLQKRPKILKVVEPPKKGRTHWSLWEVHFDYGVGKVIPAYMNEDGYKRLMATEILMDKGVTRKEIDALVEAVQAECARDHAEEMA